MKALSLRAPWAWAVVHAGKRIENRTWTTRYRGPILIHASRRCARLEYAEACAWMAARGLATRSPATANRDGIPLVPDLDAMPRGGVVARARLVDVIPPSNGADGTAVAVDRRWHMAGLHGFVLVDVEPVEFKAVRGGLGLFELAESAIA